MCVKRHSQLDERHRSHSTCGVPDRRAWSILQPYHVARRSVWRQHRRSHTGQLEADAALDERSAILFSGGDGIDDVRPGRSINVVRQMTAVLHEIIGVCVPGCTEDALLPTAPGGLSPPRLTPVIVRRLEVARFETPDGWCVQAFRFTLDPTEDQATALARHFGARRKAYN